jgi:EAL domain-containing protein (putative c-di-GMP-specific phosphodiesterase class I)
MPVSGLQPPGPAVSSSPIRLDESAVREFEHVLKMARSRLDMDVAWVSESAGALQIIRAIDGDGGSFGVAEGSSAPVEGSYSSSVLDGRVAHVIPDAAADPRTAGLAMTRQLGVGSYVGVPIELVDGQIFGTLCCLSHLADPRLGPRDADSLAPMAQLLSGLVLRAMTDFERQQQLEARIKVALSGEGRATVFQTIVNLDTLEVVGLEALTRFRHGITTDWFSEAAEVGLGVALELAAIGDAVRLLSQLPGDVYLSVNASPVTAGSPLLEQLLAGSDGQRVVVEITRDAPCQDYHVLNAALAKLRDQGIRIAVDDAGSDFAGLSQILELPPEFIKLDMATVRDIDSDPVKATLAESLMNFAQQLHATVVAVGVETESERKTLLGLGVHVGQGYLFSRPGPIGLWSSASTAEPAG